MNTKKCVMCREQKSLSDFSKNRAKKDGLNSNCKACHKILRKKHYDKNQKSVIKRVSERRDELMAFVTGYKVTRGCAMCGENHPACLDLHHRDPETKDNAVSHNVLGRTGWGMERVMEELDKCDVLCANCHRKIHYAAVTQ